MSGRTILLVEDNRDDEDLALHALRKNRIADEVVVARDGAEALERLFGPEPLPELVLLDLKLPKVDGLEVLQRLRGHPRTRLLPVVILTSSAADQDRAASYGFGANSYIRKPVDFVEFNEAVKQLGRYWLGLNLAAPRP